MNKCNFNKDCDGYKASSKKCNHKRGKHCKIHKKKKKNRIKIEEELKVLNKAVECDAQDLVIESDKRIKDLLEEEKQVKITNLLDALSSRFEKKFEKQKMRDMN